jgi:hypothetical protein
VGWFGRRCVMGRLGACGGGRGREWWPVERADAPCRLERVGWCGGGTLTRIAARSDLSREERER